MQSIPSRLPYLPGLDGLRALAVLAVLVYHTQPAWLPGGFLGVEVFFVISGYLITAMLLHEWRQHRRIDLARFWLQRARRLLPALITLLTVTLLFTIIVLPGEVAGLSGDTIAALLYVSNWYLIFAQQSYFEAIGRPSLLQHLWSLAVEEQFYVLWPLLLTAALRRWQRQHVMLAVAAGALLSTLWMALLYQPGVDPSRVYYGTDTRAAGLLIGVLLAFVLIPERLLRAVRPAIVQQRDAFGVLALVVLLFWLFWWDAFDPLLYQGGFALVATTTMITIGLLGQPLSWVGRVVLGWSPLRWVGLRSYSIYLWHWPVFMVTRPWVDIPMDGIPLLVLRFGITLALADLSYRFIETPFRNGSMERSWQQLWALRQLPSWSILWPWAAVAGVLCSLALSLGMALAFARPPDVPSYLAVDTVRIEAATPIATAEIRSQPVVTATLSTFVTETDVLVTSPLDVATAIRSEPDPLATGTDVEPTRSITPTVIASPTISVTENVPEYPFASPTLAAPPTPEPFPPTAEPLSPTLAIEPVAEEAPPPPALHVTAVGDSVMLTSAEQMQGTIANLDLDAAVSRQMDPTIDTLRWRRDAGLLGDVVVVQVGNNGPITVEQFDAMMQVLAGVPRVLVVNVKVPLPWEGHNNAILQEGVPRYANAVLVDWYNASVYRPEWFWDDGVHPRPEGAQVYADLIAGQLVGP
ncbi:MAG: acyltransferase [Chloroflexaceae bacterium]|nr:acyltransferase [Chloroflexaceae bacterium]